VADVAVEVDEPRRKIGGGQGAELFGGQLPRRGRRRGGRIGRKL